MTLQSLETRIIPIMALLNPALPSSLNAALEGYLLELIRLAYATGQREGLRQAGEAICGQVNPK